MRVQLGFRDTPYLPEQTVRVLIVDDHPVAADGLKTYLETADDMQVIGICRRGEDVLDAVDFLQPHVVILDLALDGSQIDGIEVARLLRETYLHHIKLLVISAFSHQHYVQEVLRIGVDGYLKKTSSRVEIIEAIRLIASGGTVFDPDVLRIGGLLMGRISGQEMSPPHEDGLVEELTKREWDVLLRIAAGYNNAKIARHLVISEKTVKTHIGNIFAKLRVRTREQAAVWCHLNRRHYGY